MKALFSMVSLLVALAVVGMLVSKQLRATNQRAAATAAEAPASGLPVPVGGAVESPRQMQEKLRDDLVKAVEQGAARRDEADK